MRCAPEDGPHEVLVDRIDCRAQPDGNGACSYACRPGQLHQGLTAELMVCRIAIEHIPIIVGTSARKNSYVSRHQEALTSDVAPSSRPASSLQPPAFGDLLTEQKNLLSLADARIRII
jgi:hypothetical protein